MNIVFFMFDLNNELKTIDQNIQLHQPDAFDVEYKEVFTSELGYGGSKINEVLLLINLVIYFIIMMIIIFIDLIIIN